MVVHNWRSYKDAKKFVHSLNLKSKNEWAEYTKSKNKPKDIPTSARTVYKKDEMWESWGDWLGTGTIATYNIQYRSFGEARKFGHSIKARTSQEWKEHTKSGKKPDDIPSDIGNHYKNKGWKGWSDFLNTKEKPKKERYRPFKEARKFVRSLKLESGTYWREYSKSGKKPPDIPYNPDRNYKEWKGMGDWLGTGNIASQDRKYRSYNEARKFARSLKFKNVEQWKEYTKSGEKPDDIPASPSQTYENKGWLGMGDFLGTGKIGKFTKSNTRSFKQARKFVRSLKLKGGSEWSKYSKSGKRPDDIPGHPDRNYKEWKGWGDFLGTGRIANKNVKFWSFTKARTYVSSLSFKNSNNFRNAIRSDKLPEGIPRAPDHEYKKSGEWEGWGDFLGTGFISHQEKSKNWLSANEARIAIKKITKEVFGGKPFAPKDWADAHDADKIPKNLPKYLDAIYDPNSRRNKMMKRKKK